MNFYGIKKVSLIDFPQKIACTVFTKGCNLRCPFCHNPELVDCKIKEKMSDERDKINRISEEGVLEFLQRRQNQLDAIVFTGGEPLLHLKKLLPILEKIKRLGLLIKIDTNGTIPQGLHELIINNLVDFIAMDFKVAPQNYEKMLPNIPMADEKILETLRLIRDCGVDYEIRTTVVPTLHDTNELEDICKILKDCKKYAIQNFVPAQTLDLKFSQLQSFSKKELLAFKGIAQKYITNVEIRDNF